MSNLPSLFISYHGSNEGTCEPSLPLAKEIKRLLEGKVDVYLYADDRKESFYKDNKDALKKCQNLLLVAVDKAGLESKWVESEVDNFDAMIKNGLKPGGQVFALIDGKCTHKDLINFNPIFAGKDCLSKETFDVDHFVALLKNETHEKSDVNLSLTPERIISKEIIFKTPFNLHALDGVYNEYDADYIKRNMMSDFSLVSFAIIKDFLSKYKHTLFFFKVFNPSDFLSYFSYYVTNGNLVVLIGNDLDERIVVSERKVIGRADSITFANKKHLEMQLVDDGTRVSVSYDGKEVLSFSNFADPKYDASKEYSVRDLKTDSEETLLIDNNYANLTKYIVYSYYDSSLFNSFDIELKNLVCKNFAVYKIKYPYPANNFIQEESLYRLLDSELYLHDEIVLAKYLYSLKLKNEQQELLSQFFDTSGLFLKICKNLHDFYMHGQKSLLLDAVSAILEIANRRDDYSMRRHNSAMRIATKLYINNIFLFPSDYKKETEILSFLEYEKKFCVMPLVRFQISTYLYVLHKEYIFNGRYHDVDKELTSADDNEFIERALKKVIDEITAIVNEEKEYLKTHPGNTSLINVIAFGIRHRCVMYERSGDNETNASRKKEQYLKWYADAKEVIDMDAQYPGVIDQEILGCSRQNYVYADMRLTNETDKVKYFLSVVKEAEKTKEIMTHTSSKRVFIYSELQIAEAYTELLKVLNFDINHPKFVEAIDSIVDSAAAAYEVIQNTVDDLARAWIYKFNFVGFVCYGVINHETSSVIEGLQECKQAMKICEDKTFIYEAVNIVNIFSKLLNLICDTFDIVNGDDINTLLKQDIIAETKMMMKVIDFISIDETNLIELQNNVALTLKGIMSDD